MCLRQWLRLCPVHPHRSRIPSAPDAGQPIDNGFKSMSRLPPKTGLSEATSKDLKKRDFNFVGPTIVYAFMQAVGMINDHTVDGFRCQDLIAKN